MPVFEFMRENRKRPKSRAMSRPRPAGGAGVILSGLSRGPARGLILCLGGLLLFSCASTRNAPFAPYDAAVAARDYETAAGKLYSTKDKDLYRDKDQVLRFLDSGVLYHYAGMHAESIRCFSEAERLIEENYTRSVTDAAASFIVNDYQLVYAGEDYEDIYLNVFKAIDFIQMDDVESAFVEIRRVNNKLNRLEDKYGRLAAGMSKAEDARGNIRAGTTEFHNSALARYLSLLLYRDDGKYDDAAIDLNKLYEAFRYQPQVYPFPAPQLDFMLERTHKARVNLIAFTGQSPVKRATTLRLNTGENLILITAEVEDDSGNMTLTSLNAISFPGIEEGYNFKCQLPEMRKRGSNVSRVQVLVDGQPAGNLSLLEELDTVALETFKLKEGLVMIKTITRTITKGIAAQKAKEAANNAASNAGTGFMILSLIGGIVADVAVEASEQADLRSARYFPGRAYVGEIQLDPGAYEITFEYYSSSNHLLYREVMDPREYRAGRLNLLASYNLE